MLETRFAASGVSTADPLGGLFDVTSAPVGFGYYEENASDAATIVRCHEPRNGRGPTGWWNRHRRLRAGVGMALVLNLGFLPAVQDALLTAISHIA
ncbi:hypothetical protein [Nocardia arthritidis]|uniref:Uncharacterized protein n=1 Tax=Nocardia arthritidis TaxID=228602 RepID=A0A6G9YPB8_9NOCA|nr:hypothetical protein [Nocardia arthritidis]QIS14927.1 hypothetical protein F5544_35480 [Nocardia arthritidis]